MMKKFEVAQVVVGGLHMALEGPFSPTPVDEVVARQGTTGQGFFH